MLSEMKLNTRTLLSRAVILETRLKEEVIIDKIGDSLKKGNKDICMSEDVEFFVMPWVWISFVGFLGCYIVIRVF